MVKGHTVSFSKVCNKKKHKLFSHEFTLELTTLLGDKVMNNAKIWPNKSYNKNY